MGNTSSSKPESDEKSKKKKNNKKNSKTDQATSTTASSTESKLEETTPLNVEQGSKKSINDDPSTSQEEISTFRKIWNGLGTVLTAGGEEAAGLFGAIGVASIFNRDPSTNRTYLSTGSYLLTRTLPNVLGPLFRSTPPLNRQDLQTVIRSFSGAATNFIVTLASNNVSLSNNPEMDLLFRILISYNSALTMELLTHLATKPCFKPPTHVKFELK